MSAVFALKHKFSLDMAEAALVEIGKLIAQARTMAPDDNRLDGVLHRAAMIDLDGPLSDCQRNAEEANEERSEREYAARFGRRAVSA